MVAAAPALPCGVDAAFEALWRGRVRSPGLRSVALEKLAHALDLGVGQKPGSADAE